jgi:hypothetical protein
MKQVFMRLYIIPMIFAIFSCEKIDEVPITVESKPFFNVGNLDDRILSDLKIETKTIQSNDSLSVISIASSKYHIGFPDIVKHDSNWYVTFRYSDSHLPINFADIIVLKSGDQENWIPDKYFSQPNYDLRDPKFCLNTTNNELFLQFHSTTIQPYGNDRNDFITNYSSIENQWENPSKIIKDINNTIWLWRPVWEKNNAYVVGYFTGDLLKLFKSTDGYSYKEIVNFDLKNQPTETTLRFFEDTAYIIIRVITGPSLLGKSQGSSLLKWDFEPLPWPNLGGPNFVIYKNYLIIAGRVNGLTKIFIYNLKTKITKELVSLPSYGDTGYTGLYLTNDTLNMVYYTSSPTEGYKLNLAKFYLNKYKFSQSE